MGDFTRVKSLMNFHGGFYPSGNTLDYKMTHWLFTLFQIISNILTSSLLTFSVIYTFYFYIAFEELTIYKKCSIKSDLYSLFYRRKFIWMWPSDKLRTAFKISAWWASQKLTWVTFKTRTGFCTHCILCKIYRLANQYWYPTGLSGQMYLRNPLKKYPGFYCT